MAAGVAGEMDASRGADDGAGVAAASTDGVVVTAVATARDGAITRGLAPAGFAAGIAVGGEVGGEVDGEGDGEGDGDTGAGVATARAGGAAGRSVAGAAGAEAGQGTTSVNVGMPDAGGRLLLMA